jgi:3-oxocholest-4-en-26-oate---CoA ligase
MKFTEIFELIAERHPENRAVTRKDCAPMTWREFDGRSWRLASHLAAGGVQPGARVAAYLRNCSEYLEVYNGCFKIGAIPFNTNYRYGPEELVHLYRDAAPDVVVFHREFAPTVGKIRPELPGVREWIVVDDGTAATATGYLDYAAVLRDAAEPDRDALRSRRSGSDALILYTGGTTGHPKGVVWRLETLFTAIAGAGNEAIGIPAGAQHPEDLVAVIDGPGPVCLPACPLMHGTGLFTQFIAFLAGGSCVIMPGASFDAAVFLQTVEREQVNIAVIVGDAFARPILAALEAAPGEHDLRSIRLLVSSGVTWSREVKEGLLQHLPNAALYDSFGSSEAVGLGSVLLDRTNVHQAATSRFAPNASAVLLDDADTVVDWEPGASGRIGITGPLPDGYFGDPAKTATLFKDINGLRYAVPGDYVQVEDDGSIRLLGRGASTINTGGEKVFTEELDELLKRHPAIRDAACVGLPDQRFGEIIVAVIEADETNDDELRGFMADHLARYKLPRRFVRVASLERGPSGKLDYRALRERASRSMVETSQ